MVLLISSQNLQVRSYVKKHTGDDGTLDDNGNSVEGDQSIGYTCCTSSSLSDSNNDRVTDGSYEIFGWYGNRCSVGDSSNDSTLEGVSRSDEEETDGDRTGVEEGTGEYEGETKEGAGRILMRPEIGE